MFGISGIELMIIAVFVLVIFGPERLPELGRTFGKAMSMFKRAQQDMEHVIKAEMYSADKPKAAVSGTGATSSEDAEKPAEPAPTPAAEIWASTDEGSDEDEEDEE